MTGDSAADPLFFATPADFREWLEAHHETARELWVGFHKRDSGRPSITWPESVDEALCLGWIDGVRKSLGAESYVIRFTPRKAESHWSAVNVRRMAELAAAGRVRPAGQAAFDRRSEKRTARYAYEQRHEATLEPAALARFQANAKAWEFFSAQPPWYRKTVTYYIGSAMKPETRERRLARVIACSEERRPLDGLDRTTKATAAKVEEKEKGKKKGKAAARATTATKAAAGARRQTAAKPARRPRKPAR